MNIIEKTERRLRLEERGFNYKLIRSMNEDELIEAGVIKDTIKLNQYMKMLGNKKHIAFKSVPYECVKAITRALKNEFKGIQANSYGFCCNTDYDAYHKYINDDDYMCAKIFKGGLNNQYHNGKFEIDNFVYYCWELTNFKPLKVLSVMNEVANRFGCVVCPPLTDDGEFNSSECFVLKVIQEVRYEY